MDTKVDWEFKLLGCLLGAENKVGKGLPVLRECAGVGWGGARTAWDLRVARGGVVARAAWKLVWRFC